MGRKHVIQIISSFSFLWLWSAFQGTKQRVMLITFKSELFKVAVEERIEREELRDKAEYTYIVWQKKIFGGKRAGGYFNGRNAWF